MQTLAMAKDVVDMCQTLAHIVQRLRTSEGGGSSGAVLGDENATSLLDHIDRIVGFESSMSRDMASYLHFDVEHMMREHGLLTEGGEGAKNEPSTGVPPPPSPPVSDVDVDVARFVHTFCGLYETCVSALLLGVQRTKSQHDVEAREKEKKQSALDKQQSLEGGEDRVDEHNDDENSSSGVHRVQEHQLKSIDELQLRHVTGVVAKLLCVVEWGANQAAQSSGQTDNNNNNNNSNNNNNNNSNNKESNEPTRLLPLLPGDKWTLAVSIVSSMLLDIEPLFTKVFELGHAMFVESLVLYKGLGKLQYVTFCIFRTLLAHGFCRSKEEDAEGDGNAGNMQFEDDVEGTGMGEGDGKKDVSDQIEDEEQLLGLKGDSEKADAKPEEKKDPDDMDKGLDMENDFEGDMFDMKKDEQEQDDDEDDGQEDEMERELGELDEKDEDVVDEQMWGGDDDDDRPPPSAEEKFEENAAMQGEALEDEMHTKEDEEGAPPKGKEEEPNNKPPEPTNKEKEEDADEGKDDAESGEDEHDNDGQPEDPFNNDDNVEESHGIDPMQDQDDDTSMQGDDENVNEEDDFDLPDKMELDKGEDKDAEEEGKSSEDGENEDADADPLMTGDDIDMEQEPDGEVFVLPF